MSVKILLVSLCAVLLLESVYGHGMVLDPVNRGSRWRYDSSAPTNYDDNGNFCGGFYVIKFLIKSWSMP